MRLRIRVQPRAARTEVAGPHGGALRIRVAAPPVAGEANRALVRFVAKKIGAPAAAVRIISGATSRTKVLEIRGVPVAACRAALDG